MMHDPNILAVVMFGRGRLQNGVLVQPKQPFAPEDEDKLAEFRNKIWCVRSAYAASCGYSRRIGLRWRRSTTTPQPILGSSKR